MTCAPGSGGKPRSSPHLPLMTGICRSLVTSMMPWLMFSSVSWSCSALCLAFASVRRIRSMAARINRVSTIPASRSKYIATEPDRPPIR